MATRRTTTVTEEEPEQDAEYIEVIDGEEDEDQQLDALEGMISEFQGAADAVVNVYRQGEGKNLSFLFRTNPGEMTGGEIMERCRDRFGTGDYRVHIRKGPRLVANKPFSVEAEKEDEKEAAKNGGLDTMAFITMLQESNKQTMAMFTEAMKAFATNNNNAPPFDPIAAQTAMIQSVATLKGLAEPKDDSKNAVAMLIQGLTLAKELGPKDGETNSSDILLEGIRQFAPALTNAAQQMNQRGAPGSVALPPPGDPQANADAEREREMGIRNIVLRQQLAFLVQNAANGKNPELYAELLLDQLGETVVLEFVGKPDALEKLVAINADVANYSQWFESLRASILELTADTGDTGVIIPEPTIPEPPGDAPLDAISDADDKGDTPGDPARGGGDARDA